MADLKVPPLVRLHGKVAPAFQAIDLEMLHKMSRQGKPLSLIAQMLPCLWFFQPSLRYSILLRYVENDDRIGDCVHWNEGTGNISYLEHKESDLMPAAKELIENNAVFTSLLEGLLGLPKSDREMVLRALHSAVESVKTENDRKARNLYIPAPIIHPEPLPRKRQKIQKTT